MYQIALVAMIYHLSNKTFHPIYFFESSFPGPIDNNDNVLYRFKSKGHHTTGFPTREAALTSAQELIDKLKSNHCVVYKELDQNLFEWDGDGIPADVQVRNRNMLVAA